MCVMMRLRSHADGHNAAAGPAPPPECVVHHIVHRIAFSAPYSVQRIAYSV